MSASRGKWMVGRVALVGVAALFVFTFLPAAGARPEGDFEERAAAFPKAKDTLPKPADLEGGFRWPWDGNAYTEEEWRGMFDSDPRAQAQMLLGQLAMLTEEQYREMIAGAAALAEGLAAAGGAVGEAVTGGGQLAEGLRKSPATLEQAMAETHATIRGVHDWWYNDYCRERAVPGAVPDSMGFVATHDDSLGISLTIYTDEYLESHRDLVDISGAGLKKMVDALRETERRITEANEGDASALEEDLDRMAEYGRLDSDEARARLKVLDRIATSSSRVEGKLLSGAGKGFLVIVEQRDCEKQKATVTGRIRRGNAVIDLTRLADGPFVTTAWGDSEKLLRALAERLEPYSR